MPATEHFLKGLFIALAIHAGIWASYDPADRWITLVFIDALALLGLTVALTWAALRTGRGRNRPMAHLVFLLLQHGTVARAGLVGGMAVGALALTPLHSVAEKEMLGVLVATGLLVGAACGASARVRRPDARFGMALLTVALGVTAGFLAVWAPWRENPADLLPERLDMLLPQILLLLLLVPVLDTAGESAQTESDGAVWCALLGLALWLPSRAGPPALVLVVLVVPVVAFAMLARLVLPGWASFKLAFRGRGLARQGDLPGALACFRKALRLNPADRMAREGYWRTHLELEPEGIAADPLARRLVHPGDCLDRAAELLRISPPRIDDAKRLLVLAERLDPALEPQVCFWRAVSLLHQKREDEAFDLVAPLVAMPSREQTEEQSAAEILGWRLLLAWHKGARERVGEPALALPGRRLAAISAIERGLLVNPTDDELWAIKRELYSGLTMAEFRAGRDMGLPPADPGYLDELSATLAEDEATWQRAADYMAMATEAGGSRAVRRLIGLARLLERHGQNEESLQRFHNAAVAGRAMGPDSLEPEDRELYFRAARHQAELAEHEGRGTDAIGWWQATLASERSGIETLRRLAALYEAAGDPLAALRYVVRGLVYQSDDKDLLDRRERYLWSLPLDGPSTTAEALRGLVEPAHCIRRAREILDDRRSDTTWLEVAEHLLVLAERVDPDNLTARVNLARARLRLGDRDAAVAGYESVRAAKPSGLFQGDAPEAWQLANQALGELYLECGRPKDAVACLLDFRDSPKAGAATLFKLGQAYEEMRDIKRARSYYTQVTGYEGNPLVWQAREAIDRLTNGTNNADPSAQ